VDSKSLASFMVPGAKYGYTGMNVGDLTSTENTLCVGLFDESGSTRGFAREMELCVGNIIKAMRLNPRKDNMMYRHCHFGTNFREHHGYTPVVLLDPAQYDGCYQPGGQTHLYDSEDRVLAELMDYAQQQAAQKYLCNGMFWVLTDGCDYGSTLRPPAVRDRLEKVAGCEALESVLTYLIGVNDEASIQKELEAHAKEVGFTGYIPMGKADEKSLAKLAKWVVAQSVSQSQALGSGGPSKSLTF
jgi:hypothetical protein